VCVGLDPVLSRLPGKLRDEAGRKPDCAKTAAKAIRHFCCEVIDAVADIAPCVKPQAACFERYLWHGVKAYHRVIRHARERGLLVIADAKRGDIGASSEHYAAGLLDDPPFADLGSVVGPDALTVNSYLGVDGLEPFVKVCESRGKGLFALVRTSNPGGDAVQSPRLADGRSVAEHVGALMAAMGHAPGRIGASGYSFLGAVVGATRPEDAATLRRLMPAQLFLVPGFGAQGGRAEDVRACFHADGRGAIITASRSVLYAYEKQPRGDWQDAVAAAAAEMRDQVRAVIG
jgi:orotidine-5'-phosphate decarboxylase